MAVAAQRAPIALPWRQVRQASRRLSWGIADQAMGALTNFLLSAYIAHTLGATQFGAFTLAYVTYGFMINASRGLSVEPLLIRFSGTDVPTWRRAVAGCTGTAILVGLVGGICALAMARLVAGTTGQAFTALGLTLPGLMLQDSWRHSFFALGRPRLAFINDAIWAAVQIPLIVLLKMSGHATVFWFVLAWGMAGVVAATIGPVQAGVMPSMRAAAAWLSKHRDLGPRYLAENAGSNAADTFRSYMISSILGLAAVGYIQAAGTLMGPFRIIYYGMSLITIPEATRILRRSPGRLPLFSAALSIGLTLLALLWGVVLLIALPRGLGHLLLGSVWRPSYPLVLPAMLSVVSLCATAGPLVGLHALGAAGRSLRAVILNSVFVLACALLGAVVGGALGSMRFAAAASLLGTLMSWWQFRKALHESGTIRVPRWLWPPPGGAHHRYPAARGYHRHARVG